jgi:hypothetical protein
MKNNEGNHLLYFIAFGPCFQPKDISADKARNIKWIINQKRVKIDLAQRMVVKRA